MSDLKIPASMPGPNLSKLENLKKTKDYAQLEKSAKEFEGFFMDIVMKSMRESAQEPGIFGDSNETKLFQSMLDTEYSKMTGDKGRIGLADAIVRQLAPHLLKVEVKGEQ